MTTQEIKNLFKEYGVGMASVSDLELLMQAMTNPVSQDGGATTPTPVLNLDPQVIKDIALTDAVLPGGSATTTGRGLESRPMLIASLYRNILKAAGNTDATIADMIPATVSGPLTITDLQLSLIHLAEDYVPVP